MVISFLRDENTSFKDNVKRTEIYFSLLIVKRVSRSVIKISVQCVTSFN